MNQNNIGGEFLNKYKFFRIVEKTGIYVEKALKPFIIILALLMLIDVSLGVFARYILHNSPQWTEELARYLMIWMALLATSVCQRRDEHVYMTFLIDKFPKILKKIIKVLTLIAIFYFLYVMFDQGITMVLNSKGQVSTTLKISMLWPLLIIPIAALANMIQVFLQIILEFRPEDYKLEIEKEKEDRRVARQKRLEMKKKEADLDWLQ